MPHPTLKYTLWLLLLTTYLITNFQFTLLEMGHQLAHWGDGAGHHHFYDHDTEHQHEELADFSKLFEDEHSDSQAPHSQYDLNLKQPQWVTNFPLVTLILEEHSATLFSSTNKFPNTIYLKLETPPPDRFPTLDNFRLS